jgi:hypothetical protein
MKGWFLNCSDIETDCPNIDTAGDECGGDAVEDMCGICDNDPLNDVCRMTAVNGA